MYMMTVSLCVVAYNEEIFLPDLLKDFKKQTYPHDLIEIVLIDSKSTDTTKQIMNEFAQKLLAKLPENSAYVSFRPENRRYLTGITSSNGMVLISAEI